MPIYAKNAPNIQIIWSKSQSCLLQLDLLVFSLFIILYTGLQWTQSGLLSTKYTYSAKYILLVFRPNKLVQSILLAKS